MDNNYIDCQHGFLLVRVARRVLDELGGIAPGSVISAEDLALPQHPAARQLFGLLYASTNHLAIHADTLFPIDADRAPGPATVYVRSMYSACRSALECAGAAAWLMEGFSDETARSRNLALVRNNAEQQLKAWTGLGNQANADQARAVAADIAALEVPYVRMPTYLDLVGRGGALAGFPRVRTEYLYRLSSAAVHGVEWYESIAHYVNADGPYPKSVPDMRMLGILAQTTGKVVSAAALRFLELAGHDPSTAWAEAVAWLWQTVPLREGVDRSSVPSAPELLARLRVDGRREG